MKIAAIVAEDPASALERVHEELGPDAVIVRVRKVRPKGVSWLWQRSRQIEVTACVPEAPAVDATVQRSENQAHKQGPDTMGLSPVFNSISQAAKPNPSRSQRNGNSSGGATAIEARPAALQERWKSIAWLESNGLLPAFTKQLEEKARILYGGKPLPGMQTEWAAITDLIVCHWLPAPQPVTGTGRPHVFIGPPGSGKTTALCKWMTSAVLSKDHSVKVWRLDADSANSSELLELHCELMGTPVERFWRDHNESLDFQFVDLPGVETRDSNAMSALREHLSVLPQPHVHLVLNAAYESSILFEQFRAFEPFAPEDIIFTHLDEEHRRVKLWNFVLGTKCPIGFLGAGQKIPGEFRRAEPALLFPQKNGK